MYSTTRNRIEIILDTRAPLVSFDFIIFSPPNSLLILDFQDFVRENHSLRYVTIKAIPEVRKSNICTHPYFINQFTRTKGYGKFAAFVGTSAYF